MALALLVLLTVVVGVASQYNQGAVLDPSSTVASAAGSGYSDAPALQAPQNSFANQDQVPAAGGSAPAAAGAVTSFNPLATAPAAAASQTGITDVVNAAMNGDASGVQAAEQAAIAEVPQASGQFVDGFIEGWFEKVVLETGEKTCIRQNVHKMTTDGVGVISTLAQTIMQVVAKATPNMLLIMGGAGQVVELVTTTQALVKQCVKQDALAIMTKTFNHLKNPDYVRGRLMANGLEITQTLADSVGKAETESWTAVGTDFGTVLRKSLLSDDSQPVQMVLRPGMTQPEVAPAIMEGIIEGMFVKGTAVQIKSTSDESINIFIDLHRCIAKEAKYVSMAMSSVYLAVSQLSTQIDQMKLASQGIQTGTVNGQPTTPVAANAGTNQEWMQGMSGMMSNIPVLMNRCGITVAQRADMKKAFEEIDSLKAAFTIPGPSDKAAAATQASSRMEQATKYWQAGYYNNFGIMTGGMLRDLLLTMFPSKVAGPNGEHLHSLTGSNFNPGMAAGSQTGGLGASVASPSQFAPSQLYYFGDSWERPAHDAKKPAGSLALYVGGFCAVTLLGMATLRVKSPSRSEHQPSLLQAEPQASDLEGLE